MYLTFFSMLLETMQSALNGLQSMVSGVAVALAILVGMFKVIQSAWLSGGDHAMDRIQATIKHEVGMVAIVAALCFPFFDALPGGVLGSFPSVMVKAGFVTAEKFTAHLPAEFQLPFDQLGRGVDKTIKNTKTPPLDGLSKEFEKHYAALEIAEGNVNAGNKCWDEWLETLALQMLFTLLLCAIFTVVFFWCLPLLICLYGASWLIAGILAGWAMHPGFQIPVDPIIKFVSWIADYIITWAVHFIFYTVVYFSFALMMISFCIRAVVFCVTAPLSLVTMPFDSKRRVVFEVIWKAIALALTPTVIAITMAICTNAYSLLISSGMFNVIRETYVSGAISPSTIINWEFLGHIFDYILRLAVFIIAMPGLLALVAMKAMWQAPRFVEEMFGVGIGEISAKIPGAQQAAGVATKAAV